jgi:hypothetical protein
MRTGSTLTSTTHAATDGFRRRLPPAQIDRRLSQDLLDGFVAAGASKIFVGYATDLRGPRDIVTPYPNHENHMHVRFRNPD